MNVKAKKLYGPREISKVLRRIASQVIEFNADLEKVAVIGIRAGGVPLAERLVKEILESEGVELPMGILDITLYRDDVSMTLNNPVVRSTDIPFNIDGKVLILVDDVLFTGRTTRAALDALVALGRPKAVQLAVLIDRGNRELPIAPNYAGRTIKTDYGQSIRVRLKELNGEDKIELIEEIE